MGGWWHTPAQRAEFDRPSTPERIDWMRLLRIQRMTEMHAAIDKCGEAIKALYAALTPSSKKPLMLSTGK